MLISSGILVSKCCRAVIVMDGGDYQCSRCLKRCESDGTLGDHADKHFQLEREVIEAARAWHHTQMSTAHEGIQFSVRNALHHAVETLEWFEAKQK